MKNFKIANSERTIFETNSLIMFRKELSENFNLYSTMLDIELTYIANKNVAENVTTFCLDEFNHEYLMDELDIDSIELVTQDMIQEIDGLTIVENDWLDDFDGAENEMSMIPVSDEYYSYNGFIGYGSKANMVNYYY